MSTELSHEQKKPYPIYFKAETSDGQVADRLEFAGNGTKKKLKIPLHFKESKEYLCANFHRNGPCSQYWDFSSWQPDIILVNLGTNDFMIGLEPSEEKFEKSYKKLLKAIRENNPLTKVFAIRPLQYSCPGDAVPNAQDKKKWKRMAKYMKHVVEELDDSDLHFVETGEPEDPWLDCDDDYVDGTHPTADGHIEFAKRLKRVINPYLSAKPIVV